MGVICGGVLGRRIRLCRFRGRYVAVGTGGARGVARRALAGPPLTGYALTGPALTGPLLTDPTAARLLVAKSGRGIGGASGRGDGGVDSGGSGGGGLGRAHTTTDVGLCDIEKVGGFLARASGASCPGVRSPVGTGIAPRTGTCLGLGSVELVGCGGRRVASVVGGGAVGAARI
ncbi:hypothetical protein AB0C14_20180, partial [Microbispora hainanensis]